MAGEFIDGQSWMTLTQCDLPQEHPHDPQVNMKGEYSETYLQRHPSAPAMVDWTVRTPPSPPSARGLRRSAALHCGNRNPNVVRRWATSADREGGCSQLSHPRLFTAAEPGGFSLSLNLRAVSHRRGWWYRRAR
jgi:hypothetical protein